MRKDKKNGSGADSKQLLMDIALRLFAQKGYASTTVREICDAAGTTAPSLYYYFGSKEGLYTELMQVHCARLDALLESSLVPADESAKDRLKELVHKIFHHVMEERDFFRLMFTIYYGPPQGGPFLRFHLLSRQDPRDDPQHHRGRHPGSGIPTRQSQGHDLGPAGCRTTGDGGNRSRKTGNGST